MAQMPPPYYGVDFFFFLYHNRCWGPSELWFLPWCFTCFCGNAGVICIVDSFPPQFPIVVVNPSTELCSWQSLSVCWLNLGTFHKLFFSNLVTKPCFDSLEMLCWPSVTMKYQVVLTHYTQIRTCSVQTYSISLN